jgi:hypothetical protein
MSHPSQATPGVKARRAWPPIPVQLKSGEKSGCGLVLNLSLSSAFVATSLILRPKSHLQLVFATSEAGHEMQVEAEVVWHNHRFFPIFTQLPAGYGIRFADTEENRRVLSDVLKGATGKQAQSVA